MKTLKRFCFTVITMWCLIQGLILSSFILLDSATSVYFPFFKTIVCHCLSSLPSFISLSNSFALIFHSLTPLLSPYPIAFLLISPAHSFFSRSRVQLFRPLNLSVGGFVFVRICGILCDVCIGDGSNIAVAILQKSPWRYQREVKVCFICWSVFLFFRNLHRTLWLCFLFCCYTWIHAFT